MDNSNATHNAWLIHRELQDERHLDRERVELPSLLGPDEMLKAVASAGLGVGKPGVLAVTDRRLVYLAVGFLTGRMKTRTIDFDRIERVETVCVGEWAGELRIWLRRRWRTLNISIVSGCAQATQLRETIRGAVGVFEFRRDHARH